MVKYIIPFALNIQVKEAKSSLQLHASSRASLQRETENL